MSSPTPQKVTFEHHHSGFGIGHAKPRLSWRFATTSSAASGWKQTRYEIEISRGGKSQNYRVDGDESVLVPWPAEGLLSRESATVRVRCFGKGSANGEETESEWSPEAVVEAAFFNEKDWQANFITSARRIGPNGPLQPLRFRKQFSLPKSLASISKARLYVTALGVFEPWVNGKLASDELMAPGWTAYGHRLNYRVHDVTSLLSSAGQNVLAIEAAEGWYAGRLCFLGGRRFCYDGEDIAVLAQLEITSGDGEKWTLSSDESWSCEASAIQTSEIYDGEYYDATKENAGWNVVSERETAPSSRIVPWPKVQMVAPDAPPVRITEEKTPIELIKTPKGKMVLDFGQNLVGKVRVKSLNGPQGHTIIFGHAEVLENGELGTRPLRIAKNTDTVICDGSEIKDWCAKFTFHGFRYMQIDGWPTEAGELKLDNFVALVVHTDMERTGLFECSNSWLNKLHQNTVWSMRGNFLSIPTDCPQRDERLGWTGDIQVFAPSASFLYNTSAMLGEWCQDLMVEQLEEHRNGVPALVCPDVLPRKMPQDIGQAIWDDAVILVPWVLYQYSRDAKILERQFPSMEAWLRTGVRRGSDELWDPELWQLADWLDPTAPPDEPGSARTDFTLVADAYLVHVTKVFSQICGIVGKQEQAEKYTEQASRLRSLFQQKYISPKGNLMSSTQTGISLAVAFDLYPNAEALQTAKYQLGRQVRYAKFHIATGFAGTPVITHALAKSDQPQLAYRMLLEKTCPSWLYPVSKGATTIWERWDSMLPDGSINPGEMTSFNHYALGSVVDFLHQTVGGVGPAEPGWRVLRVKPVPGGNVTSAKVSFLSPYGLVRCAWSVADDVFSLELEVPPNCKAMVALPSSREGDKGKDTEVGSGVHTFSCSYEAAEWPPKVLRPLLGPPRDENSSIAV